MLTKPPFDNRGFRGKNNIANPTRILPSEGSSHLAESLNADIDNDLMADRRGGFGPPSYAGASIHSLWSNGKVCLFIQGSDLKSPSSDFTATTILAGAAGLPEWSMLM